MEGEGLVLPPSLSKAFHWKAGSFMTDLPTQESVFYALFNLLSLSESGIKTRDAYQLPGQHRSDAMQTMKAAIFVEK